MKQQGFRVTGGAPGFSPTPGALLDDERIEDPTTIAVYTALASYLNFTTAQCFPSAASVGKRARCSAATATRHIRALVELGHVEVVTSGKVAGRSNVYHLVDPWGRGSAPVIYPHAEGPAPVEEGGTPPVINERDSSNESKKREPSPSGKVAAKYVTDVFWNLYREECRGAEPLWKNQYTQWRERLWRSVGQNKELVDACVRSFFKDDWFFTRGPGRGPKVFSFDAMFQHWNEVLSRVAASRPKREEAKPSTPQTYLEMIRQGEDRRRQAEEVVQ